MSSVGMVLGVLGVVVSIVVGIEVLLALLIDRLRRTCPWIIVPQDMRPKIEQEGLARFIEHGWDPELGWCRKPGTSRPEEGRSGQPARYHIDEHGSRRSPGRELLPLKAVAYGDSYAFCRQVNDDETWPHYLGELLEGRVENRGVGNFGLDQALLRLEREFDGYPAPVVVMAVVPETICRVVSIWKHFYEYGNVLAFKPKFELATAGLRLVPNIMDTPEKFARIAEFLPRLCEQDMFYREKFAKDLLSFPYIVSLWRSWRRNVPLLVAAARDRTTPGNSFAFRRVMERNIGIAASLYRRQDTRALLLAIARRFARFVRSRGSVPALVMLPQLFDLYRLRAGDNYYASFVQELENDLTVIDFGPDFAARAADDAENYIDDRFGGHLSARGNRIVAQRLAGVLHGARFNAADSPAGSGSRDRPAHRAATIRSEGR